jgi:hypothetical protein
VSDKTISALGEYWITQYKMGGLVVIVGVLVLASTARVGLLLAALRT